MFKPNNYYVAASFSLQSYSGGGVCMYFNSYLQSSMIDPSQCCIEEVVKVRAAQLNIHNHSVILLCIYRSPSGNFGEFAAQLDLILKYLFTPKVEFIICGDFKVNFLTDSSYAQQVTLLLQYYSLFLYN
jgi:hypothetical protein